MGSMLNLTGALTGAAPTPFLFGGVQIRVVIDDAGAPWFVAQDVCTVLGLGVEQTRRLDDDEKGLRSVQTPGGEQQMVAVNEMGLYALVLGSRKPEAKVFKRWVTREVLPAIRQTGSYSLAPAAPLPALPQTFAAALRLAADQQDIITAQAAQLEAAAPAVEFVGRYVESTGLMTFRQVAKLLQVKEPEFRRFLHAAKIMYPLNGEWTAHAQHIEAGRFEMRAGTAQSNGHAFNTAKFTAKGVEWVAGELAKWQLKQRSGEADHG